MGNPRKPDIWEEKMDYTSEMDLYTDVLKDIEHSKLLKDFKAGKIKDKYYPYESYEGGEKTIGFGHKIGKDLNIDKLYNFEEGLSAPQIEELFMRDLDSAYKRTWQHFFNQYSQKDWDRLSDKSKVALTDVSFQKGLPSKEIMDFYIKGDKEKVIDRIRGRGYKRRDDIIIEKYIKTDPYFSTEEAYLRQWNKEDNIFA